MQPVGRGEKGEEGEGEDAHAHPQLLAQTIAAMSGAWRYPQQQWGRQWRSQPWEGAAYQQQWIPVMQWWVPVALPMPWETPQFMGASMSPGYAPIHPPSYALQGKGLSPGPEQEG